MPKSAYILFGTMIAALGVIGLIYGDFALVWQRIPIENLPGRTFIAYACAVIELVAGLGLVLRRTARVSSAVLFVFMTLWAGLLKLPAVVAVPEMEATWLGFGEIAVMMAGAWILFTEYAGEWERAHLGFLANAKGVAIARLLFALSLPMIGLSHFVYSKETVEFVPHWLPFRLGWAYLTGAGSIAAGLGVLFRVWPRLAAAMEAWMLTVITLLVWGLGVVGKPTDRVQWTGFFISFAIASGAWAVAASYHDTPWLAVGQGVSPAPERRSNASTSA
jgi:uncharacterized membrane protein